MLDVSKLWMRVTMVQNENEGVDQMLSLLPVEEGEVEVEEVMIMAVITIQPVH